MKCYECHLSISPQRFLAYYRGEVSQVFVRCSNGLSIQFPASLLKQFVTADGIHGEFVLTCEGDSKGAVLQRLP